MYTCSSGCLETVQSVLYNYVHTINEACVCILHRYVYTHTYTQTHTQDQYEKVCSHTEQGIEFIKRVSTFVEKRIHIEQGYAKDIRYRVVFVVSRVYCNMEFVY